MSNNYPNVLYEPNLVHDLDKEYLKLINYYSQIKRTGIFVEYYNINDTITSYDDNLFSTYDHSNFIFDKYRLTPLYNIEQISNNSQNDTENAGDALTGETTIVINTIKRPKINDLIKFYPPHEKSEEIFKVSNISTISYAIHATPNINWYTLSLIYAPKEKLENIKIYKDYIFDIDTEQNVEYKTYCEKIKKLSQLTSIYDQLESYYNSYFDLYEIDYKALFVMNNNIWKVKTEYPILKFKKPYGFESVTNVSLPCSLNENSDFYDYYDLKTNSIETYRLQNLNDDFELAIKNSLTLGSILNSGGNNV